jgi:ribosome-binding factor A
MKRSTGTARDYPRTARLNHLLHEIVAEEVDRLDDPRLGFLTIVGVEVDADLRHAVVWYTTFDADEDDAELREALDEHRVRLQSAIARQARMKRTPELAFRPDAVIRQAERVEQILRDINDEGAASGDEPAGGTGAASGSERPDTGTS